MGVLVTVRVHPRASHFKSSWKDGRLELWVNASPVGGCGQQGCPRCRRRTFRPAGVECEATLGRTEPHQARRSRLRCGSRFRGLTRIERSSRRFGHFPLDPGRPPGAKVSGGSRWLLRLIPSLSVCRPPPRRSDFAARRGIARLSQRWREPGQP